jgi:hypothetical protein
VKSGDFIPLSEEELFMLTNRSQKRRVNRAALGLLGAISIFMFLFTGCSTLQTDPTEVTSKRTDGKCFFPGNFFCDSNEVSTKPVAAKVAKAVKVAKAPKAKKPADNRWTTASMSFPTGLESTSNIRIDKYFPKKVLLGQPYLYKIKVTNLTALDLDNVNIIESFPENFEVIKTEPALYDTSGEKVAWALGKLQGNATRTITVHGKANSADAIPCCTEANFKNPALCLKTTVVDSGLELALRAPEEKLICDTIPLEYIVKNTGTTDLKDVVISSRFPGNIVSAEGKNSFFHKVGNIAVGEQKIISTVVQAKTTGDYSFLGSVRGTPSFLSGSSVNSASTAKSTEVVTKVLKPQLSIVSSAEQEEQYIGRPVKYNFEVTNTSETRAESATVVAAISKNALFKSASHNGTFSEADRAISWDLGSLAPNESRTVQMSMSSDMGGPIGTTAEASAICSERVAVSKNISVVGIPALLLEVIDLHDPLEVGDATVYEIRVTNQGTGNATNIQLAGEYEEMSYVASEGQTTIQNAGKNLSFGKFSLRPKEVATWQIKLKASKVGDHRFKLGMDSDQLQRLVEETESTTVY